MKKLLAMFLAAAITLTASAGTSVKENDGKEFSTVKVFAPVHLVMTKAPVYSVRVMSRNKELASSVRYSIKDGVLRISSDDLESLEQAYGHVTVFVTSPVDIDYKLSGDMKQVYATHHPFIKRMKK